MATPSVIVRLTPAQWLYVLGVTAVATTGFLAESTPVIVLAALLSLPASVVAAPAYYLAYGLLALLPGANPSSSTGSGSCSADGVCQGASAGDPAAWFTFTTDAVGILLLTVAALVDVFAVRALVEVRRSRAGDVTC